MDPDTITAGELRLRLVEGGGVMERNWTSIGEPFTSGEDRSRVESAIGRLKWKPVEGQKPMMPALGISGAIKQLRLPGVSKIAIAGADLSYPDGDSNGLAHYALYGIECAYVNGRARVYLLDQGGKATVLCSDFYPAATAAEREAV